MFIAVEKYCSSEKSISELKALLPEDMLADFNYSSFEEYLEKVSYPKANTGLEPGMVCILDTNDGTVEVVRIADLTGIKVYNFDKKSGQLKDNRFDKIISNVPINGKSLEILKNGNIRYKNWEFQMRRNEVRSINGIDTDYVVLNIKSLLYMFTYKGYMILRCKSKGERRWFSLAVDVSGKVVSAWSPDRSFYYGNTVFGGELDSESVV